MGKLLPILLILIGLGAGLGAGFAFRPEPELKEFSEPSDCECASDDVAQVPHEAIEEETGGTGFVKMNNQFIVPIVHENRISALVVLSLSIEVPSGETEVVYQREPKLRDIFLQTLFDHANSGGFDGAFTAGPNMEALRQALRETARAVLGKGVKDVLITDIARQDI